jgi:serine/threonine protein kinase
MSSTTEKKWKHELKNAMQFLCELNLQHLMDPSNTNCSEALEALNGIIDALGTDCARLEAMERVAWDQLHNHSRPMASEEERKAIARIQQKRKEKDWRGASNQLHPDWMGPTDTFPAPLRESCIEVWEQLEQTHKQRVAFVNLRSFREDMDSPMNLDNCFDMKDWELVEGGASGFHTSKSNAGVFKATGLDRKNYAVKCVRPDFNSPEEVKQMKREVESHSILLHPCVLQYSGDYSISSSHFLNFISTELARQGSSAFRDIHQFSDLYAQSRNFLFIVSEFCSGGNMVHYVHGHPRPHLAMHADDATHMRADALGTEPDGSQHFRSHCAHHLYVLDHVLMFPPGCNSEAPPFLAKVAKISDCPPDSWEGQDFWACRVPNSEASAHQYFRDLNIACFPSQSFYFQHVFVVAKHDGSIESIRLTLPRPGFAFLRNFGFRAIHALVACSLKSLYHGDVRLENFFLRQPIDISDVMCGDDDDCVSVAVQLGDFDLATSNKNHAVEFATDRLQLVVAL